MHGDKGHTRSQSGKVLSGLVSILFRQPQLVCKADKHIFRVLDLHAGQLVQRLGHVDELCIQTVQRLLKGGNSVLAVAASGMLDSNAVSEANTVAGWLLEIGYCRGAAIAGIRGKELDDRHHVHRMN